MMKKNSMAFIFLSSICIILCITQATDDIHLTSAKMSTLEESTTPSPTTDDPPSGCQNFSGKDPKDPLLNVPSNWRPDYARNDPCWTPLDDKNCTVAEHVFNPDQGIASYTFTCFKCTYHMQSAPSGSSSYYYCNNK